MRKFVAAWMIGMLGLVAGGCGGGGGDEGPSLTEQ
jgi:hypothetical protein